MVSAVERGTSKCQASRTFDVSLPSVKRYVKKKPTTENPWGPEEEPRICSEAGRAGQKAPYRRSRGTSLRHPLQERRDYIEAMCRGSR
jgi:hypothetical protein